jgi:hypothetical protein
MDLEGQKLDDLNGKFDYNSEIQQIRSIGAVTISSELFEKVHTLRYRLIPEAGPTKISFGRSFQTKICESNAIGFPGVRRNR